MIRCDLQACGGALPLPALFQPHHDLRNSLEELQLGWSVVELIRNTLCSLQGVLSNVSLGFFLF